MSPESSTVQPNTMIQNELASAEAEDAAPAARDEKRVPVSEAIRYRKRAQSAEQQLDEVKSRLQQAEAQLNQSRKTIDHLERRQQIDAMLAESDAVDMEVARLLNEAAVEVMDQPDVQLAIDDLRRHKPYLFRKHAAAASAMSAHVADSLDHQAQQAANQAVTSGDRRDLLRYLRLRRKS